MKWAIRIALGLLFALALVTALRPGASYSEQDRAHIAAGQSAAHWAGTDSLGRDRLTRSAVAMLLCVTLASVAAALATGLAASIAILAAYAPPVGTQVLLLVSDALLALPGLFLLMMVRSALPLTLSAATTAGLTFLLLALLGWPLMVRTIYAEARQHRFSMWMLQGRASGLSRRRLLVGHMLPHLRHLLWIHFLLCVPAFITAEANLGALGLGVPEPLPSWGGMLQELAASALFGGSRWRYLPVVLLVLVLALFELLAADKSTAGDQECEQHA